MTDLPVGSFIIQRLQEGGWRVIHRWADLTEVPIADFVSYLDADEWVKWKSGDPKINPYAAADKVSAQPEPVIEIAIEPKSKADQQKLGIALAKLAAEDPLFRFSTDQKSGQTILKGMGELHLDIKIDILKRTHKVDLNVGAPQVALREVLQLGKSVLLEPIMKVEVVTPEDYAGSVIGDLNSRRGQIQGQDMRGNANVINVMVPLKNMFGYANNLRSMSQGRATFTMQFDHYAPTPTPSSTS